MTDAPPDDRVMDVAMRILHKEGVRHLFCYPTTPIIEAAAAIGIRPVLCRQERVGVDMANGFARVNNGRPFSVFAMQYGPGAENAFSGIATAFSDSMPVLFLPLGHRREVAQVAPTFRSSRTYASVTRHVEEIVDPREVGNVMRRAVNHAEERPPRAGDGRVPDATSSSSRSRSCRITMPATCGPIRRRSGRHRAGRRSDCSTRAAP